jgi:hypothetical protein
MPFLSRTKDDYDWRFNIAVDDIIDVCDTSNVWINSTIIETRTREEAGTHIQEVFIGTKTKLY